LPKPTPVLIRGRWIVDLRWCGLGRRFLKTPGTPDRLADAIHEAYAVYHRERAERGARALEQNLLHGPNVAQVVTELLEQRDYNRRGGERYVRGYAAQLVKRWGGTAVNQFEPPNGTQLLRAWRDEMAAEGLSPKTRRNYLNVLDQVLRHAATRSWLRSMPVKPRPTLTEETLTSPDAPWYSETDFRALRAGLYQGSEDAIAGWLRRRRLPEDVEGYVARRRLYLSFGFYTGMHVKNLNQLLAEHVSPDFGSYWRQNDKSAAVIPPAAFDCPEQLWLDIKAELARLGRPWHAGELICGGAWNEGSRVVRATAERLGLPREVNFRSVLRRSTVYELAIRGWSERECADVLGHVDEQMIRTVYRRVPLRLRSPSKIPWDLASSRKLLGGTPWTFRAPVLELHPRKGPHRAEPSELLTATAEEKKG
jgi:integrase